MPVSRSENPHWQESPGQEIRGLPFVPGHYTHLKREPARVGALGFLHLFFDGMPSVVLWRPEALDCRALNRPETSNGFCP